LGNLNLNGCLYEKLLGDFIKKWSAGKMAKGGGDYGQFKKIVLCPSMPQPPQWEKVRGHDYIWCLINSQNINIKYFCI
jgi:hypothetical protein